MCAVFEFKKQVFKPGKEITAKAEPGIVSHVWAGFARAEILDWWQRKGGVHFDIHADRFAERSDKTGRLIWDSLPHDYVIRGLLDYQTGNPLIKIVTRESSREELLRFQHPRMPLIELPLFGPMPEVDFGNSEPELF